MKLYKLLIATLLPMSALTACSDDPEITRSETEEIEGVTTGGDIAGFYVLNEGNMGSNKCTLDYFDYASKTYTRNIYAERNPKMPMELGDSGNDIVIYKNRMYISLTGSSKVEVLDAGTAKRIGQIDISSPRSLAFDGDYMYVTSFVGGEGNNGSVVKCDLNTLKVVKTCPAGLGPEEMVIADGKLYVANSAANYEYDNKLSVIDLSSFTASASIPAGVNMRYLKLDKFGNMWATAQGNYSDVAPSLVLLQKNNGEYVKVKEYNVTCSNLTFNDSKVYYYSVEYDENRNATNAFYSNTINASGLDGDRTSFITDGSGSSIASPYCIKAQPSNGSVIITDAKNYVSSGEIRSYSADGNLQWKATTGDIPGHIAFLKK